MQTWISWVGDQWGIPVQADGIEQGHEGQKGPEPRLLAYAAEQESHEQIFVKLWQ